MHNVTKKSLKYGNAKKVRDNYEPGAEVRKCTGVTVLCPIANFMTHYTHSASQIASVHQ